ncbi:hypothetical protein DFQ09_106137 [Winogradskyella pacifica]|uniref:Uncharacterized protein n=1 Tax=Winogradskyella pacifica TaxID=664642 RepID=A0A3D9LPP9_9FLAO|nr:hypothetical protein [Winogradskyella pacifica]REE08670.1 hypothetical protein DFQ09_106137 [Winogradskyella pacifica]
MRSLFMRLLKLIGHIAIILVLTAITQVGGIIWLLAVIISYKIKKGKRIVFPLLYLLFNLIIIPPIAAHFGREKLPWFDTELKPRNWFYPLAFRNYVNSELKDVLESSAHDLSSSGITITYLDGNFPFIDGFPLFPHLSHNDGKKIDLSLMYLNHNGISTSKKPSISGYGVYVNTDKNYTSKSCLDKGYWQYDFTKYLTLGTIHDLKLDKAKTTLIIKQLLSIPSTHKIFIEPHLKQSLDLSHQSKIRFTGCQAVRHDDHIHYQIK